MNSITIYLSEQAQRQAIRDGQPGAAKQTYDVPQVLVSRLLDLPWTRIDAEGNAICDVANASYSRDDLVRDGPIQIRSNGRWGSVPAQADRRPVDAAEAVAHAEAVIIAHHDAVVAKRAEEACSRAERERKAKEWAALPLDWRVDGERVAFCRPGNSAPDYRGPLITSGFTMYQCDDVREFAAEALAAAHAVCDQRKRERLDREEADRQRFLREREEWIDQHGSSRLLRATEEKIEHRAIYESERLAHDATGWTYYSDIEETEDDPRNPPPEAFDLLDRARKQFPEARLVWLSSRQYAAMVACPWDPDDELVTAERFPEQVADDEND